MDYPSAIFIAKELNMEKKVEIKVVIGLGNPGSQYRKNRHNIGFLVIDALASAYSAVWQRKDKMELAEIAFDDRKILLVKPQTFMNSSGEVVSFLQKKGIKPENILVIHDELEKSFGATAFKVGGSHRGHNGLRSIIGFCGPEFWRFRFGIGRPERKEDVSQFVLSDFNEDQQELSRLIDASVQSLEKFIKEGQ